MIPPWLRLHRNLRNKAKVQRLPAETFKAWINLLCSTDDEGVLPEDLGNLAYELRMDDARFAAVLAELVAVKLFLKREDGRYVANDWNDHQKRSDVSTGRVKQHRERKKAESGTAGNGGETVSETALDKDTEQTRSDTDQSAGVREAEPEGFAAFWDVFPHRADPSRPLAIVAWCEVGVPAADLIDAAKIWAAHVAAEDARRGKGDPMPRPHAEKWLRERRFETFLERARAQREADRVTHAKRLEKIPAGEWRLVASKFAAAHGWPMWDAAVACCVLKEGEGDALVMEFAQRSALDFAVSRGVSDKMMVAAGDRQVALQTRPRAAKPVDNGSDPLEIPAFLRRTG